MSFPNDSSAGLDGNSPQILKDLTAKSNGKTGLNFRKALTNPVNVILKGKVPFELRPYFFGAKLIALKKPDGGLRPIVVSNTFSRLSAKFAGYHVFESRQARYGSRQVGVGTKRGAELASHVFRCLIESPQPKEKVILKIELENVFNSINRQFMLEKTFELHPEVYNYSHSAYRHPSFLFYGDSIIKFCEGTQPGDPESPAFSRILFWFWLTIWRRIQVYGTLTMEIQVNIRAPFEKSQQNVDMEKTQGLKIKPTKCENFFLGDITGKCRSTILASFQKLCPVIQVSNKDELIILGSPLGPKSQADLLEKKINELEKDNGIVEKLDAHYGFLCWKIASVCQSCCTSWEPVHVLFIQLSWNSMTKRYATGFPKCVMWTSTIFRVLSLLCPLKCIIISTSRLFGLNFWCEWLSHDDFPGNFWRSFIY